VLRSGRDVRGVRVRDRITGDERDVEARSSSTPPVRGCPASRSSPTRRVPLRPGKGIHVTFERRIGNYGLILEGVDGRTMFLVPHGAETIVGTTDDDYYGDPGARRPRHHARRDRLRHRGRARALPQAREWRPLRAWAGVRNTSSSGASTRTPVAPPRDRRPRARDGIAGLLSVVGGKLAAYRIQAEEAVDAAALRQLGRPARRARPGDGAAARRRGPAGLRRARPRDPAAAAALERIWRRVGSRIAASSTAPAPTTSRRSAAPRPSRAAEIRYAVEVEQCRTLEDLFRHVHVGAGGCDGSDCAAPPRTS
jgi:glycerol-3-phosphate dehydrogenase